LTAASAWTVEKKISRIGMTTESAAVFLSVGSEANAEGLTMSEAVDEVRDCDDDCADAAGAAGAAVAKEEVEVLSDARELVFINDWLVIRTASRYLSSISQSGVSSSDGSTEVSSDTTMGTADDEEEDDEDEEDEDAAGLGLSLIACMALMTRIKGFAEVFWTFCV
jgi:ribosomal protein L12E/L44/L45/RPP1/RPP2